jgi:hypothetical protein
MDGVVITVLALGAAGNRRPSPPSRRRAHASPQVAPVGLSDIQILGFHKELTAKFSFSEDELEKVNSLLFGKAFSATPHDFGITVEQKTYPFTVQKRYEEGRWQYFIEIHPDHKLRSDQEWERLFAALTPDKVEEIKKTILRAVREVGLSAYEFSHQCAIKLGLPDASVLQCCPDGAVLTQVQIRGKQFQLFKQQCFWKDHPLTAGPCWESTIMVRCINDPALNKTEFGGTAQISTVAPEWQREILDVLDEMIQGDFKSRFGKKWEIVFERHFLDRLPITYPPESLRFEPAKQLTLERSEQYREALGMDLSQTSSDCQPVRELLIEGKRFVLFRAPRTDGNRTRDYLMAMCTNDHQLNTVILPERLHRSCHVSEEWHEKLMAALRQPD